MVLTIQVSAFYAYLEPNNHFLKTQKLFARSFPCRDRQKPLRLVFVASTMIAAQDRHRGRKVVGVEPSGLGDPFMKLKSFGRVVDESEICGLIRVTASGESVNFRGSGD
jgi:hypothetical protein